MRAQFMVLFFVVLFCGASSAEISDAPEPSANKILPQVAPTTFSNTYKAKIYGFRITVTHELKEHEQGQEMIFVVDNAFVKIRETSVFDWPTEDQLRPLLYTYSRTGVGRNRSARLEFDWDKNIVVNNVQKKTWKMKIHEDIQDKLNFQVQLQHDIIAGKKDLVYDIADGGKFKQYTFTVVGAERIKTPMGEIDTIKVKRTRKDSSRVTYAWMAPEYSYLLVRMQQEKGRKVFTINIHKSVIDGKAITHF